MTRQKIDPVAKAQAALDVATRKAERKVGAAKVALAEANALVPPLKAAREYAAANPALPAPVVSS